MNSGPGFIRDRGWLRGAAGASRGGVSSTRSPAAGGSAEPRDLNVVSSEAAPAAGGSAEPRESEPQQPEPQASRSGPHMAAVSDIPGTLEFLPPETSRRLSCDAGLVVMSHDSTGGVLDVGRKTRTVPAPMRRALDARDKGCRFPGCECRYTEAHHIQHWAQGGETKLDNLLLLCFLFRYRNKKHYSDFRIIPTLEGKRLFRRGLRFFVAE